MRDSESLGLWSETVGRGQNANSFRELACCVQLCRLNTPEELWAKGRSCWLRSGPHCPCLGVRCLEEEKPFPTLHKDTLRVSGYCDFGSVTFAWAFLPLYSVDTPWQNWHSETGLDH